jgi:hypothetical protein
VTLRRAIEPEGAPQSPAEAAAALADQFLFVPPRPNLRGRPATLPPGPEDGWARALRHDRESGERARGMFPVERPGTVTP